MGQTQSAVPWTRESYVNGLDTTPTGSLPNPNPVYADRLKTSRMIIPAVISDCSGISGNKRICSTESMTSCCSSCKTGSACASKERFQKSHCCHSCRAGNTCTGKEPMVSGRRTCNCIPGRCTHVESFVSIDSRCDEACIANGGKNINATYTPNPSNKTSIERFGNSAYYSRKHGHHEMRGTLGTTHWGLF
jgi:hypothetical protein